MIFNERLCSRLTPIYIAIATLQISLVLLMGCASKSFEELRQKYNQEAFEIAFESEDQWDRGLAIKKISDQNLLAKIVFEHEDSFCRYVAVQGITDQNLLTKIIRESWDSHVRATAIKQLTNQNLLQKIAVTDKDYKAHLRAIENKNFVDQDLLAEIAATDNSPEVCIAATMLLTNQSLLAKIALKNKNTNVRIAAIRNIIDQTFLAKIAKEDDNPIIRSAAAEDLKVLTIINKATDPTELNVNLKSIFLILLPELEVVPSEYRQHIIEVLLPAIIFLKNPEVVNYVGKIESIKIEWEKDYSVYEEKHSGNRVGIYRENFEFRMLLSKLYPNLYPLWIKGNWKARIPEETVSTHTRRVENIAGELLVPVFGRLPQYFLLETALHNKHEDIRIAAARTLMNHKSFISSVRTVKDKDSLIIPVSESAPQFVVCSIPPQKTDVDQYLLERLALESNDREVRLALVKTIFDQNLLAKIAIKDSPYIRQKAVEKLTDTALLMKIAQEDKDEDVRKAAEKRLGKK